MTVPVSADTTPTAEFPAVPALAPAVAVTKAAAAEAVADAISKGRDALISTIAYKTPGYGLVELDSVDPVDEHGHLDPAGERVEVRLDNGLVITLDVVSIVRERPTA